MTTGIPNWKEMETTVERKIKDNEINTWMAWKHGTIGARTQSLYKTVIRVKYRTDSAHADQQWLIIMKIITRKQFILINKFRVETALVLYNTLLILLDSTA